MSIEAHFLQEFLLKPYMSLFEALLLKESSRSSAGVARRAQVAAPSLKVISQEEQAS